MTSTAKICSICDADVAGLKRFKDEVGHYYCAPCWDARTSMAGDGMETPVVKAVPVARVESKSVERIAAKPASVATPALVATPTAEKVGVTKLKFVVVGIAAVAYFDGWPLYQVSQHAAEFTYSLKGIAIGWFALCMSIVIGMPGQMGMKWKPEPGHATSDREKMRIKLFVGGALVVALIMTGLTSYYISQQGYTSKY